MSRPRTRLVLVRHGQTDWNASGRFQGQTDIDLNDAGRRQADEVAPFLAQLAPVAIYSSDLGRARATAEPVAQLLHLPVTTDTRLREIHVGSWSGLTRDEVDADVPEFAAALERGEDFRRSPEGETADEVGRRMAAALAELAAQHTSQTIMVTSHGLAIRMGAGYLMGLDFTHAWRLGGLDNCSWTVLSLRPSGWYLDCYNRSALQALPAPDEGEQAP